MLAFDTRRAALTFAAALISSTALAIAAPASARAGIQAVAPTVHYHTVKVDGIDIFYREAGPANAPVVLLPYTVGGTPEAKDLFGLFYDTVKRLSVVPK